jgi:hypothetical protein
METTTNNSLLQPKRPTLTDLANKYKSDKGTILPTPEDGPRLGFTIWYEQYLELYRDLPVRFLEIGIGSGASVKMWDEYFTHPDAELYFLDSNNHTGLDNKRVKTFIGDQQDRSTLEKMLSNFGPLHIVIDDGGHMMGQQQVSFGVLFPKMQTGGIYFIEDLHTSYWPYGNFKDLYGHSLDINQSRSNTTVEMISKYVNDGYFKSEFLSEPENQAVGQVIEQARLYTLGETIYGPNQLGLFIRK